MLSKIFNSHTLHWVMVGSIAFAALAASGGAAAAAGGLPMASIPDSAAMGLEMFVSMYSGGLDISSGLQALGNAYDAGELWSFNHEWGSGLHSMSDMVGMGHGVGHEAVTGAGGEVVSHDAGHGGGSLSADHADACNVQDMIDWQNSRDMALVDGAVEGGVYDSRADYFLQSCHDHS
ncbi:MAG: hypothetical protein ACRBCT_02875 [Alphaproteobacteria bacterium]